MEEEGGEGREGNGREGRGGPVASPASGHAGTCPPGVREKFFLARYYAKLLTQHYLFSRIRFGMIP